jgi:uncharacterized phage-associated protein
VYEHLFGDGVAHPPRVRRWEACRAYFMEPRRAVSAHDFADELRRMLPGVPTKKLHKLLYYVQGLHLARVGEPAFAERLAAYEMGPVVANLWADEKHGRGRPDPVSLSAEHHLTLSIVVERYGHLTGKQLEDMTHQESPWVDAWPGNNRVAQLLKSDTISVEAVRDWFVDVQRARERITARATSPMSIAMASIIDEALSEDPIVDPDPG